MVKHEPEEVKIEIDVAEEMQIETDVAEDESSDLGTLVTFTGTYKRKQKKICS